MKKVFAGYPLIAIMVMMCGFVILSACSKGNLQDKNDKSDIETTSSDVSVEIGDTEKSDETSESFGDTNVTSADTSAGTDAEDRTQPSGTNPVPNMSGTTPNDITLVAQGLLGLPFATDGRSPETGFDSSGFIYYVLKENGYVNVSHNIGDQSNMGVALYSLNDLMSGDLVFFSEDGTKAQFGGIYIGDGIMISCSMPDGVVSEIDITSGYYLRNFYVGVRVI